MNTNIRTTLSTSAALGLLSFTATSALVASVAAPATLLGFGLLAVYAMVEIAVVSYQAPRLLISAHVAPRHLRRVAHTAAIIPFPTVACSASARAA